MAIQQNDLYWTYDGPIFCFKRLIDKKWACDTYAPTIGRAKANILQTYKSRHHLTKDYEVTLDETKLVSHEIKKG